MILDPVCDLSFLLMNPPIYGIYQLESSQEHELTIGFAQM
jgi:hypothetical protein